MDFRDNLGYSDLWTASKSNKTYIEYYLSKLEYSLINFKRSPDPETGLLELVYRSDPRRKHKLVYDGGYVEVKVSSSPLIEVKVLIYEAILQSCLPLQVTISSKDSPDGLKAGLSFKSEISFHGLTLLHPDSKLGVGIVLFSNVSLSPKGDFVEAKLMKADRKNPKKLYRVSPGYYKLRS